MIEIKNLSKEPIEIITRIDTSTPGCRVKNTPMEPQRLEPNQVISILGYEPGVSFVIQPVEGPEIPRSSFL
jgi:hypothetical protein